MLVDLLDRDVAVEQHVDPVPQAGGDLLQVATAAGVHRPADPHQAAAGPSLAGVRHRVQPQRHAGHALDVELDAGIGHRLVGVDQLRGRRGTLRAKVIEPDRAAGGIADRAHAHGRGRRGGHGPLGERGHPLGHAGGLVSGRVRWGRVGAGRFGSSPAVRRCPCHPSCRRPARQAPAARSSAGRAC